MPRRSQPAAPATQRKRPTDAPGRSQPSAPGCFRWRLLGAACLIPALAACGASPSPTTAETTPAPSAAATTTAATPTTTPPAARPTVAATTSPSITTTTIVATPAEPNPATADTDPAPPETTLPPTTTTNPPPATNAATTTAPPTTVPATAATSADPNLAATTTTADTDPAPPETTLPSTTTTNPPPATSTATTTVPPTTVPATAAPAAERGPPRRYLPQLVERLPHDRSSFTQGLVWRQGVFYESIGHYGRSAVRIVDPATGEAIREQTLPDQYFGEGLEVADGRVVQLTWREETAFIWEAGTLEPLGTFAYQGEGWGLCAQEDRFVMSDGSSLLTFRHLETFQPLGTVEVTREGEPVANLNELECAGGLVYANIWMTDSIAIIDPADGTVTGLIDGSGLTGLLDDREGINVLNGIAYRPDRDLFYLTGKLWPNLFLVELVPHP